MGGFPFQLNKPQKEGYSSPSTSYCCEDYYGNCDDSSFDDEMYCGESSTEKSSSSKQIIGGNETRMVNFSKALLAIVVLVAGTITSAITFKTILSSETNDFQQQFGTLADEIVMVSDMKARNIFNSLEIMSVSITSRAMTQGDVWPFVTMNNFEVEGMISNQVTGATTLSMIPIVQAQDRENWEKFALKNKQNWLEQGHMYQDNVNPKLYKNNHTYMNSNDNDAKPTSNRTTTEVVPFIYTLNGENERVPEEIAEDFYAPSWLIAPTPAIPFVNFNLRRYSNMDKYLVGGIKRGGKPILTPVESTYYLESFYQHGQFAPEIVNQPHSYLQAPIYDNFFRNRTLVGVLSAFLSLNNFFVDLVPESQFGIYIVLEGSCDEMNTYTYKINGHEAECLGLGDQHDAKFDAMERGFDFASFATLENRYDEEEEFCTYTGRIYPSDEFRSQFFTYKPWIFSIIIATCFLLTTLVFTMYDCMVQKRQKKVLDTATRNSVIVSSLFPENVRIRLIEELTVDADDQSVSGSISTIGTKNKKANAFLSNKVAEHAPGESSIAASSEVVFGSKPIADLFPKTTILFADMVGFTAWASVRDPTQVFTLLESVYHAYDMIAKKMGVYKVETVGDCYVAVAGLPNPRSDHAIVMAKFASRCMVKMTEVCAALQTTLGPDTADLGMRMGLHSGPVTAGVLRGVNGRFQLFGDTVNTTSRIETTGMKGKIHVSAQTADLLIGAEKIDWIVPREEKVVAKGKGELQTYWLHLDWDELVASSSRFTTSSDGGESEYPTLESSSNKSSLSLSSPKSKNEIVTQEHKLSKKPKTQQDGQDFTAVAKDVAILSGNSTICQQGGNLHSPLSTTCIVENRYEKLIQWNVELLSGYLKRIVARRETQRPTRLGPSPSTRAISIRGCIMLTRENSNSSITDTTETIRHTFSESSVLEEVQDMVPVVRKQNALSGIKKLRSPDSIQLSLEVTKQLKELVTNIASMYRSDNPFHNFEHASHVTMSVTKLLNRIVNPTEVSAKTKSISTQESGDNDIAPTGMPFKRKSSNGNKMNKRLIAVSEFLHDHTFGIASDPLTQFACVFSALIHDLDHPGVPNAVLVKEKQPMATKYNNKCVAEQNSVILGWDLLMNSDSTNDKYKELRDCICANDEELKRFRQLVVNVVMATDIMDKDLGALRKERWNKAFNNTKSNTDASDVVDSTTATHSSGSTIEDASSDSSSTTTVTRQVMDENAVNLKATIVLEHLIQASDVAHTMQHWTVFKKWNEHLFNEMYTAYNAGRMEKDPSEFWYKGEIGFFDFYIIPLAKKLETCGVFGASSDEYLNYALGNRQKWKEQGQQIVEGYLERYKMRNNNSENNSKSSACAQPEEHNQDHNN